MKPFPIQILVVDSTCCKALLGYAPSSPPALNSAPIVQVVERRSEARGWDEVSAASVQPRRHFKEDFIYLFTFPNISFTGILITVFT